MGGPYRIILMGQQDIDCIRAALIGAARYGAEQKCWEMRLWDAPKDAGEWLADWKPDGAVASGPGGECWDRLARLGVPCIQVLGRGVVYPWPHVDVDDHAVGRLAAEHLLSRRTLERKFRCVLGRSPLEEIHRLRVERACRLLMVSELPLEQIADRCGFGSLDWFVRIFRQHTGNTPAQYRRRYDPTNSRLDASTER